MDDIRPGYYAVIPADVRYDDQIPPNAKLLYGEISALIGAEGYCYASNQYFARIYGMNDDTISRLVTKLEKAGYIKRELEKDESGKVVRRKLFLNVSAPDEQPVGNSSGGVPDEKSGHTGQKVGENNLSNINLKESRKRKKSCPGVLTDEELRTVVISKIVEVADSSWTREIKNELFEWIMALYDPNRAVNAAHPVRSKRSVDGTFRKLKQYGGNDPDIMIWMLCSAVEAGWQGVQPPGGDYRMSAMQKPKREERQYECR